jgi:hypothetical protein
VSPVNLGALPSNLPVPNQRVQIKRGVSDSAQTVSNLVAAGTKLSDGAGGFMEISYTPRYNCYWLVRCNSIWHGVSGGWQRCDHGIYITPADLDGVTQGHQRPMALYDNTTVEWRTAAVSHMFRLAAGIAYTAYMAFAYSSGYYQQYWTGPQFTRIFGVVLGEGEV